jgi:hypothetical protein
MIYPVKGSLVDWPNYIHHRAALNEGHTVEDTYHQMLTLGVDYAAAVDRNNVPVGLVSFKMLSAALSARYGQALFAKKLLEEVRIPSVILGRIADSTVDDVLLSLIIPLDQVAVVSSTFNFFEAQTRLERRSASRSFDDILLLSDTGKYAGMISMGNFMKCRWTSCVGRKAHCANATSNCGKPWNSPRRRAGRKANSSRS